MNFQYLFFFSSLIKYELDNECQASNLKLFINRLLLIYLVLKNICIAGDKDGPKSTIENYKLDIMYDPNLK